MPDRTFDSDDVADVADVADVISLLPADPSFGTRSMHAEPAEPRDGSPLHRFQQAANEVLKANEPVRDKLEAELGKAKGDEAASFENLVAETKAQAHAEDDLDDATLDFSRPSAARSELGRPLALIAMAVIALGQWWIDQNILLSSFRTLSQFSVQCLALVAVAGSLVSAHVAGSAAKDIDFAPPLDPAAKTNRRNRAAGVAFGVGIEVMLAIVRATRTGAILTSCLLGAAGLALWVFARWIAYRHRSKELIHLHRARTAERGARGRATVCRRRQVDVGARHALTHRKLVERAHGVVDELAQLVQETEAAWAQMNSGTPFPGVASPGAAEVWHRYSQGWLPEQLRLPARRIPSIDEFRRVTVLARPSWDGFPDVR